MTATLTCVVASDFAVSTADWEIFYNFDASNNL